MSGEQWGWLVGSTASRGASPRREGLSVGTLGAWQPHPSRRRRPHMQQQRQYVGIDLHRRRSVIVRMTEDGEVLECVRIDNDPVALSLEVAKAGPDPEVALEATYGWYWAADLLAADGAQVHLVHP